MNSPKERSFVGAVTARPDIRLFLIFGQDESAIADIAAQMATQLGSTERVDIDSDRIKNDPALLADEASALSLFGDKRYVRLNFRREEGLAAVENLLALEGEANPVIATAGNLTKTSKLRKLAESHPKAMAHICYLPEEGNAAAAAMAYAATVGLKLDRSLAARIARYTGQDRKLAQTEVDKLSLYYDASPQRPATVEVAAFEALSAETGEENVSGLINQVMGGDLRGAGHELAVARDMGVDAIRIVRALQRRVSLLASLRAKVDNGANPGAVVKATRSIFWKEADDFVKQLSRWPSARLAGLNGHLLDVEAKLMSVREGLGSIILEEELLRIARVAARRS
ncbi:MAG: DNA polymerase III subunit delta [Sphingomonadaceae bacterium]|nr:DNA polymerase III subunit delta [Sphingomonadaceae bacterium]